MALKSNAREFVLKARTLTDTLDGANGPAGGMQSLQNLVPSTSTPGCFVPRPASEFLFQLPEFMGTDVVGSCILVVGDILYGMITSNGIGPFPTKDVPFAYDMTTNSLINISIPQGSVSLPTSQGTSGPWIPPVMWVVGGRVVICHPGYAGSATSFGNIGPFVGSIDISGFSNTQVATSIPSGSGPSTAIFPSDVLLDGWAPGQVVTGSGIPANTVILFIGPGTGSNFNVLLSNACTPGSSVSITASGGTPSSPIYTAWNTSPNTLVAVPISLANFNGRAWYGMPESFVDGGNTAGVQFSDSLNPSVMTNGTQAVTPGNGLGITALFPVPLVSTQTGGITQSLLVFQGGLNMGQITGDQATGNLTFNQGFASTGTLAPNSIVATTLGVMFVAPDGLRIVEPTGQVSEPIGIDGDGVSIPFINSVNPSRICAACNMDTVRITSQNGNNNMQPPLEYWFHIKEKVWTGPHTFPAILIAPVSISSGSTFIMFPASHPGQLWVSQSIPTYNSSYVENGNPIVWVWQTALLPPFDGMSSCCISEATINMQLPTGNEVLVNCTDDLGNVLLDTQAINGIGVLNNLNIYPIPLTSPWIFSKMQLSFTTSASAGSFSIGNVTLSVESLGYSVPGSDV